MSEPTFGWPLPVSGDVANIPYDMAQLAGGVADTISEARQDLTGTGLRGLRLLARSTVQPVAAPSGGMTINFPTPFAAPPIVVASLGDEHAAIGYLQLVASALTVSSFSLRVVRRDGAVWTEGGSIRVNWVAVGSAS